MAKREAFSGRVGFVLAATGAAVGLGNIWRFPFEVAGNGGAVFLLVYLCICFIVCWPIMLAEAAIGRAAQQNAVGVYNVLGHKRWRFIGKFGVLIAILILSFYNVVAGWAFGYFLEISQGNFSIGDRFSEVINDLPKVNLYAFVFMATTAFIVSKGVSSGIERISRIMMPLLLVIIAFLSIYALTLPHAGKGIAFYLLPDFSKLNLEVIYSATGHAFFSLSLGLSAIVTYGSYLPKKSNIAQSTAFITLADVSIAFLAGLMIFPFVAFMHKGEMTQITGGPSLIFSTLPAVFASLGSFWGIFIGSTFFLLMCFAALTSTISLLEIPVAYFIDEFKLTRQKATFLLALIIFLVGIPSSVSFGDSTFYTHFISYIGNEKTHSFLDFLGHITDVGLTLNGFLIAIFVIYAWKKHNFSKEVAKGNSTFQGSILESYIHFSLTYVCPAVLGSIFVLRLLKQFFNIDIF